MLKYYLILYLDFFIKGIIFMLFGMKSWSIYTCNKDFFEKKYKHVSSFGDIYKDEWPKVDKLSVCEPDLDLEGLGFIKRGLIFSINWCDYWTKRWICFFLNFGLEPFCCDDPKQNCQGDTEFITNELPESLPKHTDTILLGILSFFKIIGYGGLNALYLLILFPVSMSSGYTGSWQAKDDYLDLCNEFSKTVLEEFPKMPFGLGWIKGLFKVWYYLFGRLGIRMSQIAFFFGFWGMLTTFSYMRILFFMLSGDECGCNIFAKWEKQTNKLILIRMAIPILIWASLMFSLFMFFQIAMLRGVTSPEIMPPKMFKESLNYYFMKYDIDTIKYTNLTPEGKVFMDTEQGSADDEISTGTKNNYEYILDKFKNGEIKTNKGRIEYMNNNDESYHLNRLPEILTAIKMDTTIINGEDGKKGLLANLDRAFKNNQTVLSNALMHIYGEGLDTIYDKLNKFRTYKNKKKPEEYNWNLINSIKNKPYLHIYISPTLIDYNFELILEKKRINTMSKPTKEEEKTNNKKIKELEKKINTEYKKNMKEAKGRPSKYKNNMFKFMAVDINAPFITTGENETNDGSIGKLISKMYEVFVRFRDLPFGIMDAILNSKLLDIPQIIISTLFSDKVLSNLVEIPIFLIELPLLILKLPLLLVNWVMGV